MLKSIARCWQTTGQMCIGRLLEPRRVRRVLPVDPRWAAIRRLMQLRGTGGALLTGGWGSLFGSGLGAWESRVLRWTRDVIEALEPISQDDALWFGTSDMVPP